MWAWLRRHCGNRALHPRLKEKLADWLGLTHDEAGRLVAFLASLHDLGKASPAFQDHPRMPASLKSRIMAELRTAGFTFKENRPSGEKHTRHEVLSTWSLRSVDGERLLCNSGGLPADLAATDRTGARRTSRRVAACRPVWPHQPDAFRQRRRRMGKGSCGTGQGNEADLPTAGRGNVSARHDTRQRYG